MEEEKKARRDGIGGEKRTTYEKEYFFKGGQIILVRGAQNKYYPREYITPLDYYTQILNPCKRKMSDICGCSLGHIWTQRNNLVFRRCKMNPSGILCDVHMLLEEVE